MPDSISNLAQLFESVIKEVRRFITVGTFTGLILLYGSAPLSCRQYLLVTKLVGYFIRALDRANNIIRKGRTAVFGCGITKVRQRVFPHIVKYLLPKSTIIQARAGHQSIKPTEDWNAETSDWCEVDHLPIAAISDMLESDTTLNQPSADNEEVGDQVDIAEQQPSRNGPAIQGQPCQPTNSTLNSGSTNAESGRQPVDEHDPEQIARR